MANRPSVRAPTIKDVAAHANVSIKTVSRVLNAEPHVTPALSERVLKSIAALKFRPNVAARSLPGSKSYLVAILSDDPTSSYAYAVHAGAVSRCRELGYHLIVEALALSSATLEADVEALIRGLRLDGVIVTPPACDDERVLRGLEAAGAPYVRLAPNDESERSSLVYIDDRAAAAAMTRELIGLGHRRIGFVEGDPAHGCTHRRREGYAGALEEAGLKVDKTLMRPGDFSFEAGLRACRHLLGSKAPPTAIFASNDDMALGVLAAAGELGVRSPAQLSVAGFDDTAGARLVWPQLSTVRQPNGEMAAAAIETVVRLSNARGDTSACERTLMAYEVVMRGTTASPP